MNVPARLPGTRIGDLRVTFGDFHPRRALMHHRDLDVTATGTAGIHLDNPSRQEPATHETPHPHRRGSAPGGAQRAEFRTPSAAHGIRPPCDHFRDFTPVVEQKDCGDPCEGMPCDRVRLPDR